MIRLEIGLTILWIQFTSVGCHSVDTVYFCRLSFTSHRPLSFWSYSTRCISSFNRKLDAKAIIDVLQNPTQTNPIISPLLDDCKQLAVQILQIRFSHCYREANGCADSLARKGAKQDEFFCIFEYPPVELLPAFNHDLSAKQDEFFCIFEYPPVELLPAFNHDLSRLFISRRCPTGLLLV
ncbi:hypothetical protein SO802_030610 [Lithocarpus litseifolius]|uniref:RNase H type-1 domain-containing protein n=1 Tax=Lithocarpus litseifolius TaxID=425828 RepID=A0AAW2BI14_9ROSI